MHFKHKATNSKEKEKCHFIVGLASATGHVILVVKSLFSPGSCLKSGKLTRVTSLHFLLGLKRGGGALWVEECAE